MAVALPIVAGVLTIIGVPIGIYIGKLAASELRSGKLNVKIAAHILVAVASYVFATKYVDATWAALIAFIVGGVLSWHDFHAKKTLPSELLLVALGVMMALSISGADYVIMTSVTFVYAVVVGSLVHTQWRVGARYAFILAGTFIATLLVF